MRQAESKPLIADLKAWLATQFARASVLKKKHNIWLKSNCRLRHLATYSLEWLYHVAYAIERHTRPGKFLCRNSRKTASN